MLVSSHAHELIYAVDDVDDADDVDGVDDVHDVRQYVSLLTRVASDSRDHFVHPA